MIMKKLLSGFLAAIMLLGADMASSVTRFPSISATAEAASVTVDVQAQINKLKAVYPNGSYFSKDGKPCTGAYHGGCEHCNLQNIPSRSGLPAGNKIPGLGDWYGCASFGVYAYYVLYGHNHLTATTNPSTPVYGDLVHATGYDANGNYIQHWFIYLSEDANNYYVYDGNWGYTQQVKFNHAIPKSMYSRRTVYHAAENGSKAGVCKHDYRFVYFWKDHPHRDYYECAICGEGYLDMSSSRSYISEGCKECRAAVTPGTYYFTNKASGEVLNLSYGYTHNGNNVDCYKYMPNEPCEWFVIENFNTTDKTYVIHPFYTTKRLQTGDSNCDVRPGMNVNIWEHEAKCKHWIFESVPGGYVIRNEKNINCVLTQQGYNVIVDTYKKGDQKQIWTLKTAACTSHKYGNATYNWSSDNKTCTASRTCSVCKKTETEKVAATAKVTAATYFAEGKTVYTAKFKNTAFKAQTKTIATAKKSFANVKVSGITKVGLTLNWNAASGATGYEIQQYKNGKWVTIKNVNSKTNKYTVSGLGKNTTYKFRIRAVKAAGNTKQYSNFASVSGKTAK